MVIQVKKGSFFHTMNFLSTMNLSKKEDLFSCQTVIKNNLFFNSFQFFDPGFPATLWSAKGPILSIELIL